jgi:hypothetical protein
LHEREETDGTRDHTTTGDTDTLEKLAYDAQLYLDATVQRISEAFRLLGLEKGTQRYVSNMYTSACSEAVLWCVLTFVYVLLLQF